LNVKRLTVTPVKSAAAADAEAAAVAGASVAAWDGGDDGAAVEHAVTTRIGMIAAATNRNRDTAGSPPLASAADRPAYWTDGGRLASMANVATIVKIQDAVQPAGRQLVATAAEEPER
jgi:hypothetical protein